MTFDRLYYLVRMVANAYHCRYWKMWDYPDNTQFAIQCLEMTTNGKFVSKKVHELENEDGFLEIAYDNIYVFRKTATP